MIVVLSPTSRRSHVARDSALRTLCDLRAEDFIRKPGQNPKTVTCGLCRGRVSEAMKPQAQVDPC